MGVYGDFKKAKAMGGARNWFMAGNHVVRVESVKLDETRKKLQIFAVESTMISTDSVDERAKLGHRFDWSTLSDKDAFHGNVKQFMMAAFNLSEPDVNGMPDSEFDAAMEMLVGEEQCATNKYCRVECATAIAQTGPRVGKEYTAHRWLAVEETDFPKWDEVVVQLKAAGQMN